MKRSSIHKQAIFAYSLSSVIFLYIFVHVWKRTIAWTIITDFEAAFFCCADLVIFAGQLEVFSKNVT